jgi:hypothetical protein
LNVDKAKKKVESHPSGLSEKFAAIAGIERCQTLVIGGSSASSSDICKPTSLGSAFVETMEDLDFDLSFSELLSQMQSHDSKINPFLIASKEVAVDWNAKFLF